jgi:hypothetical protein
LILYLAETFDTTHPMRFLWLFVSNAAYYYALFFLLILKGPVISISQLAYALLMVAIFPLFWTLFFVAILFAYSRLKVKVSPQRDAYILVGLVVALDLLYASSYAQRYFSTALVSVTLVKMATDAFLVLRYRKPSFLAT